MNRKLLFTLILIIAIVLILILGFKQTNKDIIINDNGLTKTERNVVIFTKEQLEDYSNNNRRKFSEKYDEDFFKQKSLAIIYIETSNSCDLVRIVDIEENGVQANIKFEHYTMGSGIGLTVMGESAIVAEISKNIEVINIIEEE